MTGFQLTFFCWLFNHAEPLWCVRAEGVGFVCPTCLRFRVSPVLRKKAA